MSVKPFQPTYIDYLKLITHTTVLLALKGFLAIVGFFVVPLGLLFRTEALTSFMVNHQTPQGSFRYWGKRTSLPKIFWLWDNKEQGATSLNAAWWHRCEGHADSFLAMWRWLCLKHPVSNLKLTPLYQVDFLIRNHLFYKGKKHYLVNSQGRYSFRYNNFYSILDYKITLLIQIGYMVLESTIQTSQENPKYMTQPHHRYRSWGVSIALDKNKQSRTL
jgi:hypothetical protein